MRVPQIAKEYEQGGAACLSVLTDARYFQGSFDFLSQIREAGVACPLLCKEFIVEAYQLYKVCLSLQSTSITSRLMTHRAESPRALLLEGSAWCGTCVWRAGHVIPLTSAADLVRLAVSSAPGNRATGRPRHTHAAAVGHIMHFNCYHCLHWLFKGVFQTLKQNCSSLEMGKSVKLPPDN